MQLSTLIQYTSEEKKLNLIEILKALLFDEAFKNRHKRTAEAFKRNRKLTFPNMILFMIRKSVKSIQNGLNEFFSKLAGAEQTATASAFSQARSKLSHTAFIELNEIGIVEPYYRDPSYQKYKHFRVLAVDSSQTRLPNEPSIQEHFGSIPIRNQHEHLDTEYAGGVLSVLYDVLNDIAIDAVLAPCNTYEVDLAMRHLDKTESNDLLLFDRGFPSYKFLATLIQRNRHFIGRCSRGSFKEAQLMFDSPKSSSIVVLRPPASQRAEIKRLHLPMEITVRFIKLILSTGEVEVLVTSLLDETLYPTEDFRALYNQRWGIETFYDVIKNRLNLENFTGKTPEALKQDFHSTIFVSNLESILTDEAKLRLAHRSQFHKYPQIVNKAVSFNAIKNHVLELFYTEEAPSILTKLTLLFMQKPTLVRENRKVTRKNVSPRTLVNYYKRIKKICF